MLEDDDGDADLVRILLEAEDFTVLRARSAEEARPPSRSLASLRGPGQPGRPRRAARTCTVLVVDDAVAR